VFYRRGSAREELPPARCGLFEVIPLSSRFRSPAHQSRTMIFPLAWPCSR
jgi:hypothetical protein